MGECGCTTGNKIFKMEAPEGWYLVELMQGCSNCASGPGLQIYHPEATEFIDDMDEIPDLPVIGEGEHKIAMIKCGIDPDEAITIAVKCFNGYHTVPGSDSLDEYDAEQLGEDFWEEALLEGPSVVYSTKEKEGKQ